MTTTLVRRLAGALAALALLVTGALALAGPTAAADPVRIMTLGDSITGSPGCWRALLWQKLQQNGYTNIDMVGTLPGAGLRRRLRRRQRGPRRLPGDQRRGVRTSWSAGSRRRDPDVVVMHFATNDVWSNRSTQEILAAWTTLVQQMRASKPTMKILVAQIIPVAPPTLRATARSGPSP